MTNRFLIQLLKRHNADIRIVVPRPISKFEPVDLTPEAHMAEDAIMSEINLSTTDKPRAYLAPNKPARVSQPEAHHITTDIPQPKPESVQAIHNHIQSTLVETNHNVSSVNTLKAVVRETRITDSSDQPAPTTEPVSSVQQHVHLEKTQHTVLISQESKSAPENPDPPKTIEHSLNEAPIPAQKSETRTYTQSIQNQITQPSQVHPTATVQPLIDTVVTPLREPAKPSQKQRNSAPPISITIGRLEVKNPIRSRTQKPERVHPQPRHSEAMSLEEYLKQNRSPYEQ